jgi:hypothetical protein
MAERDGPGGRFWIGLVGALIAFGVGLFVCFLLFERAIYRWGAFGALIALLVVVLLIVWIHDRRQIRKYEQQQL